MKLVSYDIGTGPRAGVVVDTQVVDASVLLGATGTLRDVQAILELPDSPLERLRAALERMEGPGVPLTGVRLRSPILRPPTVRDFMAYEGHASFYAKRLPDAWYRLPIFYFSNSLCIYGQDDEVPYPSASDRLDYELEIGCVVARDGSNIRAVDALEYIAGFLIFNDWSARDLQFDEMECRLGPAKGKDTATSLGPWLVTTDELQPYLRDGRLHLHCKLSVNGEQWMDGDAGHMQHGWDDFIERASRDSRIVAGDVFGSGTVSGGTVGEAIGRGYAARYLQPGDSVELEVEGIGVLRNRVGKPISADPTYRFRAMKPIGLGDC